MSWAQRDNMLMLTIPLNRFKYHKLQITNQKMWFLGITKTQENNIFEIDHDFLHPIDPAKSGKKLGAQNELKIFLAKIQTKKAQEIKPPSGPNGQQYPSHFVKAEYKGQWWP